MSTPRNRLQRKFCEGKRQQLLVEEATARSHRRPTAAALTEKNCSVRRGAAERVLCLTAACALNI